MASTDLESKLGSRIRREREKLEADMKLMQPGPLARLLARYEEESAAMVKRLKEPVKPSA